MLLLDVSQRNTNLQPDANHLVRKLNYSANPLERKPNHRANLLKRKSNHKANHLRRSANILLLDVLQRSVNVQLDANHLAKKSNRRTNPLERKATLSPLEKKLNRLRSTRATARDLGNNWISK